MMNNKNGISAIVATVLTILITVAAITIIWLAIMPMISEGIEFDELSGRVSIVSSGGYTVYDAEEEVAIVQVKRDVDDGVMDRISIIFSIGGSSVSFGVVAPESGQTRTYNFDLSKWGEPDSVSVAPIFVSSSGKEKEGTVTSDVDIPKSDIDDVVTSSPEFKAKLRSEEGDYFYEMPVTGLVSWWKFNGDYGDVNIIDSVGGNDGVMYGVTEIVGEGGTASLSCGDEVIESYISEYGGNCEGTCPVDCGTCTVGNSECSVTYNNGNCGDCNSGCVKQGLLTLFCSGRDITSEGMFFDGVDDYVEVQDDDSLQFTNGTWSFWANISSPQVNNNINRIMNKDGGSATSGWTIALQDVDGDVIIFALSRADNGCNGWCNAGYFSISNYNNKWSHYLFTVNGSVITFYVDGEFVGVKDSVYPMIPSDDELAIGASSISSAYDFSGGLDEIMLFNRVLDEDEITAIYENQKGSK